VLSVLFTATDYSLAAAAPTSTTAPELAPVGTVPNLAPGTQSEGQLQSQTSIQLSIELRSSDPSGLIATAEAISTPGSPQYGQFLTPAQIQSRFGPTQASKTALESYLTSHGLTIGSVVGDGLVVTASGPASSVTAAMHTGIARYKQRSGRLVYANTSAPKVPSALAPSIATVNGLDDTAELQPHVVVPTSVPSPGSTTAPKSPAPSSSDSKQSTSGAASSGAASPCAAASGAASAAGAYSADVLANTYGFDSAYQAGDLGKGETVAVFELAGYSQSNLQKFERCYGLDPPVRDVKIQGGDQAGDGSIESELDIETIMSLAPKARVLVYEAPPTTAGALAGYGMILQDDKAQVVSTSWGGCEQALGSSFIDSETTIFEAMAAQGQSVVAASGDSGSEDCLDSSLASNELAVDDPASQQWVTGVGGTDLLSAGTVPFESAWNDSSGSGGCGLSTMWSLKDWQKGSGVQNRFSNGFREVPDVSASASPANGYVIYCTKGNLCKGAGKGWIVVGGTSAAAPLWAALIALADEMSGGKAGFVSPLLYKLASHSGNAFHDVTTGNNDFTGTNGGRYPATGGYDQATGLGSPNGAVLIPALHT